MKVEKNHLIGWKAYYLLNGELKQFKSSETKWIDLPQTGLQWLNRYYEYPDRVQNKIITDGLSGQDVFTLTVCMLNDLKPQLPKELKLGELVSKEIWAEIDAKCRADNEIVKEMI